MPFASLGAADGGWAGGIGDVAFGAKHAAYHGMRTGTILSVAGEIILPTGDEARGLGSGHWPSSRSLLRPGAPARRLHPARRPAWRSRWTGSAAARPSGGSSSARASRRERSAARGRRWWSWSAPRDLADGEATNWDVVPQFQVTLSRRQHILAAVGARVPLNAAGSRATRLVMYLLWDWFDGGLFEGLVVTERLCLILIQLSSPSPPRWPCCSCAGRRSAPQSARGTAAPAPPGTLFLTAESCLACHNGLADPGGRGRLHRLRLAVVDDGQLGARPLLARRRAPRGASTTPGAAATSRTSARTCHMPMARSRRPHGGGQGEVFAHLPAVRRRRPPTGSPPTASPARCATRSPRDARDARRASTAGFVGGTAARPGSAPAFGPFEVDAGRARVMRSASASRRPRPRTSGSSELCATCHTLFTHALGPDGEAVGELPEQVPYLEWMHSALPGRAELPGLPHARGRGGYGHLVGARPAARPTSRATTSAAATSSCRGCSTATAPSSASKALAAGAGGGRPPHDRTPPADAAARIDRAAPAWPASRLSAEVVGREPRRPQAADRLPLAAGLAARDGARRDGRVVFESGAPRPDGSIKGNDNDADARRFEPHHRRSRSADQVQVYESIMADTDGRGDDRAAHRRALRQGQPPAAAGFDKATAAKDVAVHGDAAGDADFAGGRDRVRYLVPVGGAPGPFLSKPSSATSPSASAGRRTSRVARAPNRSGSSGSTARWLPRRAPCSRAPLRASDSERRRRGPPQRSARAPWEPIAVPPSIRTERWT